MAQKPLAPAPPATDLTPLASAQADLFAVLDELEDLVGAASDSPVSDLMDALARFDEASAKVRSVVADSAPAEVAETLGLDEEQAEHLVVASQRVEEHRRSQIEERRAHRDAQREQRRSGRHGW